METSTRELTEYKKDFSEYGQILAVEISPFTLSQDVILIGFESKVLLGRLVMDDNFDLNILAEFKHIFCCTSLTISPETSISILPNIVIFTAAGSDYKLRVFKSNLRGDDVCTVLNGHSNNINDIKFDSDSNFLASTSDDNTVKLWATEDFKCIATFQLTSPGVSVCWHKEDNSKLLIAEKVGIIRFYNVESQSPIVSLDYGKLLSSAHWAPSDSQLIASLQLGELLIWRYDCSVPLNSNVIFTDAGGQIKFNPSGELIAAVNGIEGNLKIINVQNNNLKLVAPVMLPSNISWHCRCPVVCIGDYMNLIFWKIV